MLKNVNSLQEIYARKGQFENLTNGRSASVSRKQICSQRGPQPGETPLLASSSRITSFSGISAATSGTLSSGVSSPQSPQQGCPVTCVGVAAPRSVPRRSPVPARPATQSPGPACTPGDTDSPGWVGDRQDMLPAGSGLGLGSHLAGRRGAGVGGGVWENLFPGDPEPSGKSRG